MAGRPRKRVRMGNVSRSGDNQGYTGERLNLQSQLKTRFESIFDKYGRDFTGVGDEIDLESGQVIVDNGHLVAMLNEHDVAGQVPLGAQSAHHPNVRVNEYSGRVRQKPVNARSGQEFDLISNSPDLCFDSFSAHPTAPHPKGDRRIDPRWDAPDVPGLLPLGRDVQPCEEMLQGILEKSPSPEVSVWDWTQGGNSRYHMQKHHQTPWNAENDRLLVHLRKVSKLSFSALEEHFPGRKAASIRAHWLTLQKQRESNTSSKQINGEMSPDCVHSAEGGPGTYASTYRFQNVNKPSDSIRVLQSKKGALPHHHPTSTDIDHSAEVMVSGMHASSLRLPELSVDSGAQSNLLDGRIIEFAPVYTSMSSQELSREPPEKKKNSPACKAKSSPQSESYRIFTANWVEVSQAHRASSIFFALLIALAWAKLHLDHAPKLSDEANNQRSQPLSAQNKRSQGYCGYNCFCSAAFH